VLDERDSHMLVFCFHIGVLAHVDSFLSINTCCVLHTLIDIDDDDVTLE
jgi:hypothetical protein